MEYSKERLYRDVAQLTGIQPARNYQNLEALEEAVRYIKGELEQLD